MNIVRRNIKILVLVIAIVLVWRGVWGLADIWFFPNSPLFSYGLSVLIGILILFMANPKKHDISELINND